MNVKLRKLLIIFFSLIMLYSAYYWGIPALFNSSSAIINVEKILKEEMGLNIELKSLKIKMGILPSVWIDAEEFRIKDAKKYPLVIQSPKLKIALFPLLIKRLHILNFYCENLNANLRIDKNNRFFIGNNLIMQLSDSKLSIDNAKINILLYKIKFRDDKFKKNILLQGDYLIIDKFNPEKQVDISTNSKITIKQNTSTINARVQMTLPLKKSFTSNFFVLDGSIINLDIGQLSPYISKFSKGKIKQINGILDIVASTKNLSSNIHRLDNNLRLKDAFIVLNNMPEKIIFPKTLNIVSEFDFSKQFITIKKFDFISEKLKFKINGKILKPESKKSNLDLDINILPSYSEAIVSMLPTIDIPNCDINIPALKEYGFYSILQGKINLNGNISKPNIHGKVTASEAYILKPLDIPKATIKLLFNGDKLDLDAEVPANPPEKVFVKGTFGLYDKNSVTLSITSTDNVNLETVQTILNPLHEILSFPLGPVPVMKIKGFGNINLTTKGNRVEPSLQGIFKFNNATVSFNNLNCLIENSEGSLTFNDKDTYFVTQKAFFASKPLKIEGRCSVYGDLNFDVTTAGINLNKLVIMLKTSPMLSSFKNSVKFLEATSGNISLKLNLKGKARDMSEFNLGKNITASGDIKLLGNDVVIKSFQTKIKKLLGNIHFKNESINFDIYPTFSNRRYQIKGNIEDNKIYTKLKLDGMNFIYYDIPIKIYSGILELAGDNLYLRKINGLMDSKPLFIDGNITKIQQTPELNLYLNSKPKQAFIDKYLNKNNIYPLIVKGDINYSARITGALNDLNVKGAIKIQENSSIYYMGAVLGDTLNPISIFMDFNLKNKILNLRNFQYDKLISSQNDRQYLAPQLNAKGFIDISNHNNPKFSNFKIKTFAPTDAKIFNIMFKKIFIKQGLFESNILVNGSTSNLKILGKLDFSNIGIPFIEMTIKDIRLNFKDRFIEFKTKGDILSQGFSFSGVLQNNLALPFVFEIAELRCAKLDFNQLTRKINSIEVESNMNKIGSETNNKTDFNIKDLIIKRINIKAQTIKLRNINASNFFAELSIDDKGNINVSNYKFNIAEGTMNGFINHNLPNAETRLKMKLNNVNANLIAESLFDLSNQLYGSLNGELDISCKGHTHKECMKTLNGSGGFRVAHGKMPKLGSLEYLLKAANLVKSGVTGITINSLIDLVTPLKTGEFENINGIFTINSGIAEDIQIFSKGKNLSIFISGNYNCYNSVADLEVFGRVSKKISNILGVIGNTSINTLFNTIPGIDLNSSDNPAFIKGINKIPGFELNDKTYRIFNATIKGNLNGDDYVQSFKWIE